MSVNVPCVVCMDRPKDSTLAPCNHPHTCLACLRRFATPSCPVCRTTVTHITLHSTNIQLPISLIISTPRPQPRPLPQLVERRLMPRRPSHPTLSTPPLSPVRQADSSVRVSPVRRLIYDDGQIIEGGQGAIPSVVLIGHSRALVLQMARRLVAVFPPPMHGSDDTWKSTIFVRGISLRLVLIEATLTAGASELADRVRRHTPKLVLMCADFYDVSSFESIVRHDLQVLHHLDVACAWILVKAAGMERRALHFVEDGDVRAAKHFLSSPRKCYLLHVDGAHHAANVHKLGLYIFRMVRGDVNRLPVEPVHPSAVSNRRCVSLLCLGLDIQKRKRTHRNSMYRQYANDLTTWINNG